MIRAAFLLLALSLGATIVFAAAHPAWLAVPAILIGWYLADMASGLIHMVMDYHPCPTGVGLDRIYFYTGSRISPEYLRLRAEAMARINPLQQLVYDFKNHHPRPEALGRRSMRVQIASSVAVLTLPLSLLVNGVWLAGLMPGWLAAGSVSFLIGGTFAQYFHGTLHRETNPWIVRAMRQVGLLMTPQAHQLHHDTLKRDFSTNCGWSNPVMNRVFALAHRRGWLRDEGLEPTG